MMKLRGCKHPGQTAREDILARFKELNFHHITVRSARRRRDRIPRCTIERAGAVQRRKRRTSDVTVAGPKPTPAADAPKRLRFLSPFAPQNHARNYMSSRHSTDPQFPLNRLRCLAYLTIFPSSHYVQPCLQATPRRAGHPIAQPLSWSDGSLAVEARLSPRVLSRWTSSVQLEEQWVKDSDLRAQNLTLLLSRETSTLSSSVQETLCLVRVHGF